MELYGIVFQNEKDFAELKVVKKKKPMEVI